MRGAPVRLAAGVVLALLLAANAVAADPNSTAGPNQTLPAAWERTYGGLANESLLSLLGSPDGGYLLVGSSPGNGTGAELFLVRADANGTPVREERVPFGPGSPAMADRTPDGGLVVVGTGEGVALLRLAPDGRQLWFRSYAVGSGLDFGDAVRPATDGGYLVAGTTDSPTGGTPGILLLRVGEDGGEIWHRVLSVGGRVLAVSDLQATPDGGYLVIGSTDTDRAGSLDLLLVKVSSGGYREWERTYSFGSETADGRALVSSPDGGWLLLGDVAGTGSSRAAVLVKVDTAGAEQWRQRLAVGGARTWGFDLASTSAGGYAVAGAVEAAEGTRSFVVSLDRSGTEAWNRSFAIGNGPSRALAVTAAAQDRLVACGDASRTPEAFYDLYLSSVVPPTAAPNATATAVLNVTANLTPTATPMATATPVATTAVPATTASASGMPLCGIAMAGIAVLAARRRR